MVDLEPWMEDYQTFSSQAETLSLLDLNVQIIRLHDSQGRTHDPEVFPLYGIRRLTPEEKAVSREHQQVLAEEACSEANEIIRKILEVNNEQDE